MRISKKKRYEEVRLAVETLRREGMPVSISQVASLTGIKTCSLYNYRDLHELMGVKPRTGSVVTTYDRYTTVMRELFAIGKPMNRDDIRDELQAMINGEVTEPVMTRALNTLCAAEYIVCSSNGYYRLKEDPVQVASVVQSVLMDGEGNITIVPAGQSAITVAEKLMHGGAKKLIHLMAAEYFEPATTVGSRKV